MASAFTKDVIRSVTHSWGRFIAIAIIAALGTGFFAGLRMTGPDMRLAGDVYYDATELCDLRVVSSLGMSDEQVDMLRGVEGVSGVMPAYEADAISQLAGVQYTLRYHSLDVDAAKDFLPTMGDCDLMVGMHPNFKVHVHSNRPDQVLGWFLTHDCQISEVHVHNMKLQSDERNEKIEAQLEAERKPLGVVAVAPGSGTAKILESLGVDVVISGGQTMNPSTADILAAVNKVNADSVVILPNNKNIIMAAQACVEVSEKPCAVVATTSVPQAFSAMFGFDGEASLEENVEAMTEAFAEVKTGEVTHAIKDSKDAHGNPIKDGDVIGIADGSIEAVGSDVSDVVLALLETMEADDADTMTILAGEDFSDEDLEALVARIEEAYEDLEIDPHRGEQALYPVVFSLE